MPVSPKSELLVFFLSLPVVLRPRVDLDLDDFLGEEASPPVVRMPREDLDLALCGEASVASPVVRRPRVERDLRGEVSPLVVRSSRLEDARPVVLNPRLEDSLPVVLNPLVDLDLLTLASPEVRVPRVDRSPLANSASAVPDLALCTDRVGGPPLTFRARSDPDLRHDLGWSSTLV